MRKKLLAGLLSAVMLVTSFSVPAYADTTGDGKFDSFATAYAIKANEAVTHKLGNSKDINNYKFTFASDGVLAFSFNKLVPDADSGWGWDIALFNEDGEEIYHINNIKNKYDFGQLPFKKGTVVYLRVSNNNSDRGAHNAEYQLKANFSTPANWEAESNDKMATAQKLKPNTTYHGDMYLSNDVDYYKLEMAESGVVSFNFKPSQPDADSGWGWYITIYDEDGNELKVLKNIKTNTTTGQMAFGKGNAVYVKVENQYSGSPALFTEYLLTAKVDKNVSAWETEYNNSRTTADALTLSKKYFGTIMTSGDEDFYKVNVATAGSLAVSLASNINNNQDRLGWGWDVVLYDAKGNEVKDAKMRGIKTKNAFSTKVSKGTYYVKVVSNYSGSAPIDAVYELTADLIVPVKEKEIKVPTIKGKTITVKWKALSKINGYEIRWAKKSSMSGAKKAKVASNKTSYTIKSLKAKTTYYIQIRAYKKVAGGSTIYGNWSAKKKVKTKK